MRCALNRRPGPPEALLGEARDEPVEDVVEGKPLRDGAAQLCERQARPLGMFSVSVVNQPSAPLQCGCPRRRLDEHVSN